MYRRPDSITVIGFLLTVLGFLAMFREFFRFATSDLPTWATTDTIISVDSNFAIDEIILVLFFVSGIFIFKGANWARWLFTATCVALLILDLTVGSQQFYLFFLTTCLRALCILFLFLPKANEFFSRHHRRRRR